MMETLVIVAVYYLNFVISRRVVFLGKELTELEVNQGVLLLLGCLFAPWSVPGLLFLIVVWFDNETMMVLVFLLFLAFVINYVIYSHIGWSWIGGTVLVSALGSLAGLLRRRQANG